MSEEPDTLTKLTASIDAGESIDWDAVCAAEPDEHVRRLLEHLRVVAGVAQVHRSQIDDSFGDGGTTTQVGPAAAPLGRWGHLLLVKKIGEGAYGEVYEAIDTWLDHRRALKLLKPQFGGAVSAHQILHEARKLVRVRHPNVVMVHGADKHDGRVGFWMDLIEGHTLEERVRNGRLSAGEATYIGQEVCSALAAVHQADLVHRDVKAQNVMRADDGGRIILMDFGAGEVRGARTEGPMQGTPLYLAPELFAGGPASVQSDIYALGTLLFYLVSGGFPVEGRSFTEIAVAHYRNRRRYLRDLRPDLPDSFVRVVERALDPDPAQRFQTAGDFQKALRPDPVVMVEPARPQPARPAPDALHRLGYAIVVAVTVLTFVMVLGFIASRTLEVAFHVDAPFTAGPAEYFRVGSQGFLPFVITWIVGATVAGGYTLLRQLFRARVGGPLARLTRRFTAASPVSLAAWIVVAGAAGAVAVTWAHWSLFGTIIDLGNANPKSLPDVSAIGPGFYAAFLSHSQISAILSFVLILAVVRWLPSLERRAEDPATIERARWVAVAMAIVVVALAVAPRRIAMETFRVVEYKSQQWFVIGSNGDELLLYPADRVAPAAQRVHQGDRDLNLKNPSEFRSLVQR
jgi:tRNA A-37 threonylcarbamoyl transferase component Bud32